MKNEFDLINTFFKSISASDQADEIYVGDDAALVTPSSNKQQVISVDTSIAGRHFPVDADAFSIAYRAVMVAVSDIAAMGAKPRWITVALSLPNVDEQWLSLFAKGLAQACDECGVALIGGDTTKSTLLSITVQAMGEVASSSVLMRCGAKVGDVIYVGGCLGDAAAGLVAWEHGERDIQHPLLKHYLQPKAQLALGEAISAIASSCIDVSDGLLADLSHICESSNVQASIAVDDLPLSQSFTIFAEQQQWAWDRKIECALTGGDDYQLCFTASEHAHDALRSIAAALAISITPIGKIVGQKIKHNVVEHVTCFDSKGDTFVVEKKGYQHFD